MGLFADQAWPAQMPALPASADPKTSSAQASQRGVGWSGSEPARGLAA